jgi:hypothetical protein
MPSTNMSALPLAHDAFVSLLHGEDFARRLREADVLMAEGTTPYFGAYRTTQLSSNTTAQTTAPKELTDQGVQSLLDYCSLGRPLVGVFIGRPGLHEAPVAPTTAELSHYPNIALNRALGILGIITTTKMGLNLNALLCVTSATANTPQSRQRRAQTHVRRVEEAASNIEADRRGLIAQKGFHIVDFSFDQNGRLVVGQDQKFAELFKPNPAQPAPTA